MAGAKAATLGRALASGLPVPPGVVVPAAAPLAIDELKAALGGGPYAVRSSSPVEDGVERSWAGQLESRVPVDLDDLPAAIEHVRRSAGSDRARAYGSDGRPIPVLVQRVVDAAAAGVAFTLDPRDGDERHAVVEAVPGLGTALVDGSAVPARWHVDPATLGDDAGADSPIAAAARREVAALVLEVAGSAGAPCDVEWAWDGERAWLLQVRPVTAAAWRPAPGEWTSANLREAMPGVVTPLSASIILEDELVASVEEYLGRLGLAGAERAVEARRFYGRPYWRVDLLKARLLRLPGFVERSFDETVGIVPSYDGPGRRSPLTPRTAWTGARAAAALLRMYRSDVPEALRHARELERAPDGPSDLAAARAVHAATNRHALRVTYLAEQAQDVLRGLLDKVGESLDPPLDVRLLLGGTGPLATAGATAALEELAKRCLPHVPAVAASTRVDELPVDVAADLHRLVGRFGWMADALDDLACPRWDEDPAAALAPLKAAVRAAAVGAGGGGSAAGGASAAAGAGSAAAGGGDAPAAAVAGASATAAATRRAAEERRALGSAGLLRPLLARSLASARRLQAVREELRVASARANRVLRRALLDLGRRSAAGGALGDPSDVFWLEDAEVERLARGALAPETARAAVAERRAHARRYRNWDPPLVLGGAAPPPPPTRAGGRVLRGVACSSGRARGPVAVLRRLDDLASVEPGAVLVLKHGNPGWTPAFVAAAALVVEESGLLSHSSVIARERGLPAVINVAGACDLLRDGEHVEVDGERGLVTLLDAEDGREGAP